MADDSNSNDEKPQNDQFNNDQLQQNMNNKMQFRSPMMGGYDPSFMKMAMMNPMQYQHFQQMLFMQQLQRQQQMQRQMNSAAAMTAATTSTATSNIPPETQKPPTGYVCFKCGQPGHWIYYCPNVPKGQFVQRVGIGNRNNIGNQAIGDNQQQEEAQKPQELTCMICDKIMTNAVLVPCCGKSFCKECTYRIVILDSYLCIIFSLLLFCYMYIDSDKASSDETKVTLISLTFLDAILLSFYYLFINLIIIIIIGINWELMDSNWIQDIFWIM
ncbi:uncharacterized protein BX663DRAFT_505197 [Cokeromyces recurvatus]|uniref:uncharacterized protein n=1 Tax=Cokeromyces recurvatus TaxID=90255 RepID=UPI00221F13EE|nr:uncharacterized protein BX663DRAFT_505197 [Cokeromyces recurvatus]KAI7903780.1 hypothetical protein BX663DRAFT_505197 [Cokeromyces recurvatus]